jgi:phosphopantothenate-cysteine ligase
MDVCDHAGVTLRHLSTNAANHNMLKKIGCVDLLLNLMAAKEETSVRINAAVCVADIVGRDEMDSRMENDPTIIEETLAALEDIMDGNVVESGITFEAHELL